MNPKILAYYLPAFHEVEENNEWYGKGFTEWDNTKKGKPLFNKHYQPRVPLEQNYYDLSKLRTLEWQAELAKQFGVYGFCFYHYWFNGRKILEKPAEMLLSSQVDIPFCFAWANEPWRKTWHDGLGEAELLIDQSYNNEDDWIEHFYYLLQFFKDRRYIKIKNKPMLLIYRAESIPDFEKHMQDWEVLAKNNGFNGVHIIIMNTKGVSMKAYREYYKVDFEPNATLASKQPYALFSIWRIRHMIYNKFVKPTKISRYVFDKVNYRAIYNSIQRKRYIKRDKKYYYSAFVDWDNSPRKGKRGLIINNANPQIFYRNLKKIYNSSKRYNREYIFMFAWNEWGECGYLEPDEKFGYSYLSEIKKILNENKD